uniref:Uncharacterized protein n=1 Tax=Zea mays TaxID=4577 RepID=C4J2F0_MAIZE|nr:unknown [Zea mays]
MPSTDMRPASRENLRSVSHERRPPANSEPASPRRKRLRRRNDGLEGFSGGGIAAAAALLPAASCFLSFCLRLQFCHFLLNTEAASQKLPAISISLGGGFLGCCDCEDSRSM